jgi:dolichol-phosphate mannosyltransferase
MTASTSHLPPFTRCDSAGYRARTIEGATVRATPLLFGKEHNVPRRLDVIVPVFKEAEGIGHFHEELAAVLDRIAGEWTSRVTYVLDPSPDETQQRLAQICADDPRARTLVLSRRFGHQAALIAGMEHADADAVVMLDSDLQHPPATIVDLLTAFDEGHDVVQAIRKDAESTGWAKRTTSHWFYRLLSRVGSIQLEPGSADYRLLSRRVVEVFRDQLPERNPFIRGLTTWVGFPVAYVSYTSQDRFAGQSKYSVRKLLEFALSGVTSFSKLPIRAAAGVGSVMAVLSLTYAVLAIGSRFVGSYTPPGWASLLAVTSFVGGVQLLFLGLIAEYVGQIFDEVKGRPRYLVSEVLQGDRTPIMTVADRPGRPPVAASKPAATSTPRRTDLDKEPAAP